MFQSFSFPDIRLFLQKSAEDPTIVTQFLKSGARPLDVAQVLTKMDKNELFHTSYVFNALHLVFMEKISNSPDLTKETDAIETCSYMLNNHRASIEKLLVSNYATHKKSVLKLLTAIVYLAPHLGRELMTTFNVAFNAEALSRFTEHNRAELGRPDEDRLRTCYVHFVLSYIIEGNATLIRNILDRSDLLMAIISGLIYDSEKTVTLVVGALQKFVLHSESVSKTKKVQVFGGNVVKEFLRLFEWKGPEYLAATFNRKLKDKAEQSVSASELASVSASAYEFLKDLLSSRKHGIAFKCLGQRRAKFNAVPKRALLMIDNFWENEYKATLTIEILKACPELAKQFIQKNASRLDPHKKQNDWHKVAAFLARLIDALSPDIIQYQVDQMNVKETIELIKEICLAPELLLQLKSKNTLKSDQISIRHKATKILYLMFRQCNQYLFSVAKWNIYRSNEVKKMKFDLINHIILHCPSVENIILSLHMSQVDENCDSAAMFGHLECILDLLLIITSTIPSFIDTTSSVINYIKILGPIYELNREHESSTRIEFKAVKLMLALEPKALSPKTELFEQVLQSFFNVYRFGGPDERNEAKNLLRNVFQNTSLFENGPLEVDLWLEALSQSEDDDLPAVKAFLIKSIKEFDANSIQSSLGKSSSCSSAKNITETFENIERGVALKGVLDVPMLGNFFHFVIQRMQSSAADEDGDADAIRQYVECVAVHLFHHLPMPESVYHALAAVDHRYNAYMKRWIIQSKIGKLPDDVRPAVLKPFYDALVADAGKPFIDVFAGSLVEANAAQDGEMTLATNEKTYKLAGTLSDESQIMLFVYTTTFAASNLHRLGSFEAAKCKQFADYCEKFIEILSSIDARDSEVAPAGFGAIDDNGSCVGRALKYIFTHCFYWLQSFNIWAAGDQLTALVFELMRSIRSKIGDEFDQYLVHYRAKFCQQIELAVQQTIESDSVPATMSPHLIEMLAVLRLDADNCHVIVSSLMKLGFKHCVTTSNERSVYANILAHALNRLAELKAKPLDKEAIKTISDTYVRLVREIAVEINYEAIENALHTYLSVFYHNIGDLNPHLFEALFEVRKLTKGAVKLACLLFERQPTRLVDRFKKLLETNVNKKELVYPLINVGVNCKWTIDASLLTDIYAEYRNGILKAIEKPSKAAVIYRENVISSVFLIEKCMPLNECVDFLKKAINYDSTDVFQLQIIKAIHMKILMHSDKVETIRHAYESFLAIFVQLFNLLVKRDPTDYDKINVYAAIAFEWTKLREKLLPPSMLPTLTYDTIHGSSFWIQFGKSCLKHGLGKGAEKSSAKIDDRPSIYLKLFAFLCNQFYASGSNHEDARTFFEMTMTHPNFFDTATLQRPLATKTNLMYLLYVLVRKNAEPIDADHIPVLLGAYQAKMSACDQYILALLQLYERNGVDFHKFKPFMWGESALTHYSHEATSQAKTSLFQEPPVMQMMSLIDRDLCENTLVNFPQWRRLNAVDQVPDVEITCHCIAGEDISNDASVTRNNVERLVESGAQKVDEEVLLAAARRDETFDDVYDPAFFVPIMSMSFAPETSTSTVRPAQNGLLAFTFAALSSADKEMRLAAASALQRYRTHLESARFADSKLWFHLFDSIKNGLGTLTAEARKHKKNRIPRVPYVAGLFFARTLNILVNPLNEMYRPLSSFLLIKNTFNFLAVPEFNVLFHSPDINYNVHRAFMLDVLRDGVKCSGDFNVLMSVHIFKALLGFYDSPMSNRDKNLQILTVVNAAVKIPKSAKLMIDLVGIVPWLGIVIDNIAFFQFDLIEIICTIFNNLLYSVTINRNEYSRNSIDAFELRCLHLMMKLCPKLSSRVAEVQFVRYLNVLMKITAGTNATRTKFISEDNLNHLVKCTNGYAGEQSMWDCTFVKENSDAHQFCEKRFAYSKKLRDEGLSENVIFILTSLREIIICWNHTKQQLE